MTLLNMCSRNILRLFCSILFCNALFAHEITDIVVSSQTEALFLRKVADFWEEEEYQLVKTEIKKYVESYSDSAFKDYLWALLGDIYCKEKKYQKALEQYDQITEKKVQERIGFHYLRTLYELQLYERAIFAGKEYLRTNEKDEKAQFLLAQSLYHCRDSNPQYFEEALDLFTLLLDGEYAVYANEHLAHLQKERKNYPQAADFYVQLAHSHPDKMEHFLFQAALMQIEYDKKLAAGTFRRLMDKDSDKAADAAYNLLVLLYEMQDYEKIIQDQDLIKERLSRNKRSLYHYFLAKSYMQQKEYAQGAEELKRYIKKEEDPKNRQAAFFMLLECGEAMGKEDIYNYVIQYFQTYNPQGERLGEALLVRGDYYKQKKMFDKAMQDFQEIEKITAEPSEEFYFAYAHLLYEMQDYENAYERFLTLVQKNSEQKGIYWEYLINCSLKLVQKKDDPQITKRFIKDLKNYLAQEEIRKDEEKLYYLLAQMYFEGENFGKAKKHLLRIMEKFPQHPFLAKIHHMLAFCYYEQNHIQDFVAYAEKALQGDSDLFDAGSTHLALFNIYINDTTKLKEAAHHLYCAQKEKKISLNNLKWLSDFYYDLAQTTYDSIAKKRAITILEKIVKEDASLSPQLFSLSTLYANSDLFEKRKILLENAMHNMRKAESNDQLYFDLGQTYHHLGELDNAFLAFDQVITHSQNPRLRAFATLEKVRIGIATMPKEKMHENNPVLRTYLSHLKDLELYRRLENEPIHLEAAFEYIDLLTSFYSDKKKHEKRLFLLYRFKKEFNSQEKIVGKDYHIQRKHFADKDLLFQIYMKFVDIDIAITQAQLTPENTDYLAIAKKQLQELKEDKLLITPFLRTRYKTYLQEIQ